MPSTKKEIKFCMPFPCPDPLSVSSYSASTAASPPTGPRAPLFGVVANPHGMQLRGDSKDSLNSTASATDWGKVQGEIQKNYEQLQRSLSQEFHRKMLLWERQRETGVGVGHSGGGAHHGVGGAGGGGRCTTLPCSSPSSPGFSAHSGVAGGTAQMVEANLPADFR